MTFAPHQSQMYAEATGGDRVGLPRHAPAIVTDDTQVTERTSALFETSSLVRTRGGQRSRIFITHPQRVPSPYLRCHGRQVERIAPCRFRVLTNSNREHQFGRQALADRSPSHLKSLSRSVSFDADHPEPRGFVNVQKPVGEIRNV